MMNRTVDFTSTTKETLHESHRKAAEEHEMAARSHLLRRSTMRKARTRLATGIWNEHWNMQTAPTNLLKMPKVSPGR